MLAVRFCQEDSRSMRAAQLQVTTAQSGRIALCLARRRERQRPSCCFGICAVTRVANQSLGVLPLGYCEEEPFSCNLAVARFAYTHVSARGSTRVHVQLFLSQFAAVTSSISLVLVNGPGTPRLVLDTGDRVAACRSAGDTAAGLHAAEQIEQNARIVAFVTAEVAFGAICLGQALTCNTRCSAPSTEALRPTVQTELGCLTFSRRFALSERRRLERDKCVGALVSCIAWQSRWLRSLKMTTWEASADVHAELASCAGASMRVTKPRQACRPLTCSFVAAVKTGVWLTLLIAAGRLGTSAQRHPFGYCAEERLDHPQADAPGLQTVDHISPLQPSHHAAASAQHRAAEAVLPCSAASVLEESSICAELNSVLSNHQ